eukprot:363950-Chlamydomonas_euryale.AAC.1
MMRPGKISVNGTPSSSIRRCGASAGTHECEPEGMGGARSRRYRFVAPPRAGAAVSSPLPLAFRCSASQTRSWTQKAARHRI